MCVRCLGFVLLLWFPGVLHAQRAGQPCPAPLLNGGYLVPKQETYPHETTLSYACDKGHKLAVEGWWATSTCDNGKWSHQPQCVDEKSCILPTIPNAGHPDNSNSLYEEGSIFTVTCKKGYEPKHTTVRCENGAWSSAPVCDKSINACGEPPQIPHAVITDQGYQEVFAAGSRVQYECEDGYTTQGTNKQKTIVCSSGNWSEGPTCRSSDGGGAGPHFTTIDKCGAFPVVPHGDISRTDRLHLTYKCFDFYKKVGPDTVVCFSDGTWSEVPTCKATFCSIDTNVHPYLKSVGRKHIRDGESERLECEDLAHWWTDHYSRAQCNDGRLTLSRCCNGFQLSVGSC